MKNKLIYAGFIAAILIAVMIIYKDELSLYEIITTFIGAGGTFVAVWKWISNTELKAELKIKDRKLEQSKYYNAILKEKLGE